jgi:hypothetical protein
MHARTDTTLRILWTIAAMLFASSVYLCYLLSTLPDPPTPPLTNNGGSIEAPI